MALPFRARLPYVIALFISTLFLWQAFDLDEWGLLGPGPGLFPRMVVGLCTAIAAMLAFFPRLAGPAASADTTDGDEAGPDERRVFRFYVVALIALAPVAELLGFVATAAMLALLLTWMAERRDWRAALVFGLGCGILGVIVFQRLLGAEIPAYGLERAIAALLP